MINSRLKIIEKILQYVYVLAYILAVVFLFSGLVKANDPMGMQYKLEDYCIAWGLSEVFSIFTLQLMVIALATVEVVIGAGLLLKQRWSVYATIVMMGVLTPLTLWLALTDAVADCGCFGDVIVMSNWQTFFKNVILLLMAIVLLRGSSGWSMWHKVWIQITLAIFVVFLSVYSLHNLPRVDFSSYKVGVDMTKMYNFFVDSDMEGDVTQKILADSSYTCLLVAPFLETCQRGYMDVYNQLYRDCKKKNFPFYCLTASSKQAQQEWRMSTVAEYPFLFADDIELKTMVRSHPGLVVIKNGYVIKKYSYSNIPNCIDDIINTK